ncbi:MAG TPA: lycopene cyclase domain-containing protein [Candidatus Pacearchaeota archaeon]|nr:lycopene cyclase domain-containing protein [Candidatus Pacearchaeota archaeon]
MIDYKYTYLIGVLLALIIWIFFFVTRKNIRKEMLILSLVFGIPGPLAAYVHLIDWWKPLTIIGTPVGIEDFLFGFCMGGIAGVIYEYIFNKRVEIKKHKIENSKFIFLLGLMFLIYFGLSLILKLNTFLSAILSFSVPTLIIWIKRKDLIKNSLISGLLLLIIAIFGYNLLNLITPGFFDAFWKFQNIGKIIIFNIPLEEHIWYFAFGCFFGPIYEYWKQGKIIKNK